MNQIGDVRGWKVLDAGCGEGKNAAFLASLHAQVRAFDVSDLALGNARVGFPDLLGISWEKADIGDVELPECEYDLVIAYGLFHCLSSDAEVAGVAHRLQAATRPGGYNIVCAFNERHQELHAHPGFNPILLPHDRYLSIYSGWKMLFVSDEDLHETHPHNNVPHTHSMTRMIAQKDGR